MRPQRAPSYSNSNCESVDSPSPGRSPRTPLSPADGSRKSYNTRSSKKKSRDEATRGVEMITESSDKARIDIPQLQGITARDRQAYDMPTPQGTTAQHTQGLSVTTRSRAQMQMQAGEHFRDEERRDVGMFDRDDFEMEDHMQMESDEQRGGSADVQRVEGGAPIGGDDQGALAPIVDADVMNGQTLIRTKNPLVRLTVKLLDTYQDINEKYYAKHNKRSQDQWDDEHGDYLIRAGDMIYNRYKVVKRPNGSSPLLGKGSFGQVVYAIDTKAKRGERGDVALKIIKNHHHWFEQAKCEIALLKRFTEMRPVVQHGMQVDWVDHANIVRLVDDFVFRNHCCLVFELLPFTLYDLLKYSRFKGVSLQLVSKFASHLLRSLDCLRAPDVDVIHCDLKPENVMLVKHDDHRVKVIDFGSSCSSERQPFTYIQSRFYRSPEVLFCSPYSYAIDMWSLGCILVEMHTGQPLFNGKNEGEQIWKICDVLGMPPDHVIRNAGPKSKVKPLFKQQAGKYLLELNSRQLRTATKSLRFVVRKPTPPPYTVEQECMYAMFEDLVLKMLAYDPNERITPHVALQHPFVASQGPLKPPGRAGSTDGMDESPCTTPGVPGVTREAVMVSTASQTGGGAGAGARRI